MSTISTELPFGALARAATARRRTYARIPTRTDPGPVTPPPARYEDFERRATDLGDLLGGQVFPRLP